MKFWNKLRVLGAFVVAGALLGLAAPAAAQVKIAFATLVPQLEAAESKAMAAFKSYVESRSDNKIQIRLIHGGAGGEREIMEQVRQGTLEMGLVSDGSIAGFYKPIQVLAIPYAWPRTCASRRASAY